MRFSFGWLLLAFVVDLFSLFVLTEAVGAWWTLAWVLAAMVLGVVVLIDAGDTLRTLGGIFATPSERMEAIRETPWLLVVGLLFLLPGLVSDVLAMLLWLPAARRRLLRSNRQAQARRDEIILEGEWIEKRDKDCQR